MILYTIELEGDYITFVGVAGTPTEGTKMAHRKSSVRDVISIITDSVLTLIIVDSDSVHYKYTEVEDPSTPGIAFVSLTAFRTYMLTNLELDSGGISALTDGNGTTANGTAVDLGGQMAETITLDNGGLYHLKIESTEYNNYMWFYDNYVSFYFEESGNNFDKFAQVTFNYNQQDFQGRNFTDDYHVYTRAIASTTEAEFFAEVNDGSNTTGLSIRTDNGIVFQDDIGAGTFMPGLKSGTSQANAGAAANELWVDTADNSVKRGV